MLWESPDLSGASLCDRKQFFDRENRAAHDGSASLPLSFGVDIMSFHYGFKTFVSEGSDRTFCSSFFQSGLFWHSADIGGVG